MSRLIDADALRELFAETISAIANRPEMDGNLEYMIRSSAMAIKMIDDQMTVDAVPIRHGHWYVYETGYEDTEAKCSICGFETLVNEPGNGLHMVGDLKYCPHCGAKMDEVTE